MKKLIIIANSLILSCIMIAIPACNVAPGSYPYAERFELNVKESTLIESIQQFKKTIPSTNRLHKQT
jgi:hypothetical protein